MFLEDHNVCIPSVWLVADTKDMRLGVNEGLAMTDKSVRVAVPNGVIFITDSRGGTPPTPVRGAMVLSTPSCVAVGCMIDSEGLTDIRVADGEPRSSGLPLFQGSLETPSRAIVVWAVGGEKLLEADVANVVTQLRIWVNHPTEPDEVVIGVD
jgi:hypothetical protein